MVIAYGLLSSGLYFLRAMAGSDAAPARGDGFALMSWWQPVAIGIPVLLLLFASGLPIFVCFLILNLFGVVLLTGTAGFGMFANSIYTPPTNGTLAAVPLLS